MSLQSTIAAVRHATRAVLLAVLAGCRPSDGRPEAILQQLTDPQSAQFRHVRTTGTATCGEVNAKNRMGGYTGFKPFLVTPDAGAIIRPDQELNEDARRLFGSLVGPATDSRAFDRLFKAVCAD